MSLVLFSHTSFSSIGKTSLQLALALICAVFCVQAIELFCPETAQAQGIGGGANYSLFGLGDTRESLGGAYEGMGDVGIGVVSPVLINRSNPAAWSHLMLTRFQTGFTFRQNNVASSSAVTNQNNGEPQGFAVGFSIDTTLGWAASFGVMPLTHVSYAFTRESGSLTTRYTGKGGMSEAYLGVAFRPVKHLSVGVQAAYYFGTITGASSIINSDPTIPSSLNNLTQTDGLNGFGATLGVQYTGLEDWSFGATATYVAPLTINRSRDFRYLSQPDEIERDTLQTPMPLTLGVGIGRRFGRVNLYIDAVTRDFSTLTYRTEGGAVSFRRSNRVSIGALYNGNVDYPESFFDAMSYTVGASYHQQYYQVNGVGVNEIYGSVGVGVPITRRTMVNVSATGGVRGSIDAGLLRETFGRFSFSVNIGELWFQPFYRE
jgi:hypothetical protein